MTRAQQLAQALSGRKAGSGYVARCPAHDDRNPSLSICDSNDGKVLVRCHAGCGQGQVIASLRTRGLWNDSGPRFLRGIPRGAPVRVRVDKDDAQRSAAALAIWKSARPSQGTLVETYLASRGLHLPVPAALRFHPGLKHPSGGIWPVMLALVTRGADGIPLAIHRTFLSRDGKGKAPVEPQKMMFGPCRGGAVRLGPHVMGVMIGEGIETALSAMQATGCVAWAALSTSGMRTLDLPTEVCDVIALADGDDVGEAAARESALRWKRQGRRVRIARPRRGTDFNDMLLGGVLFLEERAP
jgi:hypothetical protein